MILSRTPLRISLVGGGTDQPEFYHNTYGAVLSFTIDKFIYVSVNGKFNGRTRVSYSETEDVANSVQLKHDLVREALRYYQIHEGVEITTVSDIPGRGSGLGSSSALTVGLVNALMRYLDFSTNVHPSVIAEVAYLIERERCLKPVGKQDHWACAYGGMHYFRFLPDERVIAEAFPTNSELEDYVENNLLLLWTDKCRNAVPILKKQAEGFSVSQHVRSIGEKMRDLALELKQELLEGHYDAIGPCLDVNWNWKREIGPTSNPYLDDLYETAKRNGARGGKICGAGAGGFFLLDVPREKQEDVLEVLKLRHIKFRMEKRGAAVVYNERNA